MKRISVLEAAKELGTTPAIIRSGIKSGRLPIGKCVKGEKRDFYLIYEELIREYVSIL